VEAVRSVLKLRQCPAPAKEASLRTLEAVVRSLREHYRHSAGTGAAELGGMPGKGGDIAQALQACDAVATGQLASKEAACVRAAAFRVLARCRCRTNITMRPSLD
jgi:hypothetical protein